MARQVRIALRLAAVAQSTRDAAHLKPSPHANARCHPPCPSVDITPRKLKPTQHNLLTDKFVRHELWERRVRLGDSADDRWIDRDAAACLNLLYADIKKHKYDPERIREAVLAGVAAWLDAGVVLQYQVREGTTEREFRRFRRHGIPSLTVQGLRQQGFRGETDSSGAT